MTNKTYLFYDIETSGLNKAFDQVYQFAAIRTDTNFNELERYQFCVKPTRDIVPSPQAILTHQMPLQKLMNEGIAELEAIQKIHALLNTPGTISLGYNTLNFDDEFLRFSFYRHLLPPYTHQYANQCGRADVYPLLILYYLYEKKPQIQWPKIQNEFGQTKISFRLENLNQANQWVKGQAHDAIVDVEATVALAKQCSHSAVWEYGLEFFNKQIAQQRCLALPLALPPYRLGLLIASRFGQDQAFQIPVLIVGQHWHYKNQLVCLRLDQTALQQTTENYIAETTQSIYVKPGEDALLLPAQERHAIYLNAERKKIMQENIAWLAQNPQLLSKIIQHHCDYKYPLVPAIDLDAALYVQTFPSDAEQQACAKFHTATLTDKIQAMQSWSNESLYARAVRLLARHYPENLPPEWHEPYQVFWQQLNSGNIVDYRNEKRLTPSAALLEINQLKKIYSNDIQQLLLNELEAYIQKNFQTVIPAKAGIYS